MITFSMSRLINAMEKVVTTVSGIVSHPPLCLITKDGLLREISVMAVTSVQDLEPATLQASQPLQRLCLKAQPRFPLRLPHGCQINAVWCSV